MSAAERLLEELLQLDDEERANVAIALINSLAPLGPRDDGAWLREIERRARRALIEPPRGADLDEALDRISRDLRL